MGDMIIGKFERLKRPDNNKKLALIRNMFLQFASEEKIKEFYPDGWKHEAELKAQILSAHEYITGFFHNILSWKEYVEDEDDKSLDPTLAYEIMYLTKTHNVFYSLNWQYLIGIEKSAISSFRASSLLRKEAKTICDAAECWHLEHKCYDMIAHCVYLIYSMIRPNGEFNSVKIGLNAIQMQMACIMATSKTTIYENVKTYIVRMVKVNDRILDLITKEETGYEKWLKPFDDRHKECKR